MSKVYYLPVSVSRLDREVSLPARFEKLLRKLRLDRFCEGKRVAIKMHLGGEYTYTLVHPAFVSRVVAAVKDAGGRPFVTDHNPPRAANGYTEETLGCPIVHATGGRDKYFYSVPVDFPGMDSVEVAGYIHDSDALITLNHAKGHGHCAFGGAIKNLAMGAVTARTRGAIHHTFARETYWDEDLCTHCGACVENCRGNAIRFTKKGRLFIEFHDCNYCMRCVAICPSGALTVNGENYLLFQQAMALAARTVLSSFKRGSTLHINFMLEMTSLCDCFGFSFAPCFPDVGIAASKDIVAVEQATLDMMADLPVIPGMLPEGIHMRGKGEHVLQRMWGKDPYVQVRAAEEIRMGGSDYAIEEMA